MEKTVKLSLNEYLYLKKFESLVEDENSMIVKMHTKDYYTFEIVLTNSEMVKEQQKDIANLRETIQHLHDELHRIKFFWQTIKYDK